MIFLVLLFIPAIIAVVSYFAFKTINWKEFLISMAAQLVIAGASAWIIINANITDVEIWNGVVSNKQMEEVSCSHSYECNCYDDCQDVCTGSGANRSCNRNCRKVCNTCYEHSYDIDWAVYTSNGSRIEIDRVDRQGTSKPKRWILVQIGEPVSTLHTFDNYIKASPGTLFKKEGYDQFEVPEYPSNIYDYYRLDRFISESGTDKRWNKELSNINASIGAQKQVNMIMVVTKQPHDFFFALQQKWVGGKKNDVVLVIGIDNKNAVKWADVMAWSKKENLKINLRDAVLDIGSLDREKVLDALMNNVVKHFERKPMKDFEYLQASITPTLTQWLVSLAAGIVFSIGLAIYFHINEI